LPTLKNISEMNLIKVVENEFAVEKEHPKFGAGDTVTVSYKIKEGNKERVQNFRGVVIQIRGRENNKTFTVRKISGSVGVERIFPLSSPFIDEIVVNKKGKVRRKRLFYLRGRTGKKARIKEKRF
jgi:large subunit ribosomal protein L19